MKRKEEKPEKEPRPDHVQVEQVLAHLATLSKPSTIRQIAHGMGLKHHGRRYLPRIIQQLKKTGEIVETHGGGYRLSGDKTAKPPAPRANSTHTNANQAE